MNPVLTAEEDVKNYSFVKDADSDELYLVMNTTAGDNSNVADAIIPAGEYLNGYLVRALDGLKIVIDESHIEGGVSELNTDGSSILVVDEATGGLKVGSAEGIHFVVTDKTVLTGPAVKARVAIAE